MGMKRKSLLVVTCLLVCSLTLGAAWTSKRLTNNAGDSYGPAVAVGGPSNVYVTWEDTTPGNNEIFFVKSTDSGATWQTAANISKNTGYSECPRIAINGTSTVYLVWDDTTPGNIEIFFKRSTDGGATWQTAKRLTYNAGDSNYPKIAHNNMANVYVVWSDTTPAERPGRPLRGLRTTRELLIGRTLP